MESKELQDIINLLNDPRKENCISSTKISCDTDACNKHDINKNMPVALLNTKDNRVDIENNCLYISPTSITTLEPTCNEPALKGTEVKKEDDDVVFVSEVKLQPVFNKNSSSTTTTITYEYTCKCINCLNNQTNIWFHCKMCNFQGSDWTCLKDHSALAHTQEKKFACYFCPYRSEYKKQLSRHMKIHGQKLIFQCNTCDYKTENRYDYKGHLKSHTGEKYLKCPDCEYRTNHKGALKIHITTHSNEKPYECYECGHKTTTRRSIIHHIKAHKSKTVYKCKDCNYECKMKLYMERHEEKLKHTRDRSDEEFRCDKCNYVAYTNRTLLWHMRVHTGERLFECFECEYKTNCSSNFRKHEILHAKKKKM